MVIAVGLSALIYTLFITPASALTILCFKVCTKKGKTILNYVAEPNELELVDLHKSFELKELELTTGHHDPEPADILGGLPYTKRYIMFMSKDQAVCVWDLATRVCARVVEVGKQGMRRLH